MGPSRPPGTSGTARFNKDRSQRKGLTSHDVESRRGFMKILNNCTKCRVKRHPITYMLYTRSGAKLESLSKLYAMSAARESSAPKNRIKRSLLARRNASARPHVRRNMDLR